MERPKKKYTKEEKLAIIKECGTKGVLITLKKHGIYKATYYNWKHKFDDLGSSGLDYGATKARLKRIVELEQEVDLLKQLLAEKHLESSLKDDLLKKKYPKVKKKYL